jgi:hypothetical protein
MLKAADRVLKAALLRLQSAHFRAVGALYGRTRCGSAAADPPGLERSPDSVPDHDPDALRMRGRRREAEIEDRLVAIDREFAELHASAIWRLETKLDEARARAGICSRRSSSR